MKKYIIMALLVVFLLGQLGTAIYITWPGNGIGDENHDHFPEEYHDMRGEVPGQE